MSLSYVHRYHAGNFADIHKHLVLIAALESLLKKEKPFGVIDAFSGEGFYDLSSKESQKIKEYTSGLNYLLHDKAPSELTQKLLSIVHSLPPNHYPGSPAIIDSLLNNLGNAHFVEKHPSAFQNLKNNFRKNTQVHLHQRDAYEALKALLPLKEKRGVIFIDPSYEVKTEYIAIAQAVNTAYLRFKNGIFIIWYPLIKGMNNHRKLADQIKSGPAAEIWQLEWIPFKLTSAFEGLYGSGIIILNPPWGLAERAINTVNHLKQNVYPDSTWNWYD